MRILVIDDEPFMLKLLTRQLANLGHADVLTHQRALDALVTLAGPANPVDVVICDLQMPEMDGVEFVRHLARLNFRGGLVLLSGRGRHILHGSQQLALAHRLRVLGTLEKPVHPERLGQLLARPLPSSAMQPCAAPKHYAPEEVLRAIREDELFTVYQPQVEIASGALVGVETLVRWQHPEDGVVFPDAFIPIAEEQGCIDDLTRLVLGKALRQGVRWQDEGLQLKIAINISMDNLTHLKLPDCLERMAAEQGLPLERLELEITESRLMRDPLMVLDILTRLRLKRVGLSIDDFGTGHSTLAQLRNLPFTQLKVDRSFIQGAHCDADNSAIVEASLAIARQLGIRSVAEGVEELDDWHYLQRSGCDLAQGYFIAPPMAAEQLPAWLLDWQQRQGLLHATGA